MIKIDFSPPNTTIWNDWIDAGITMAKSHIHDHSNGIAYSISASLYKELKQHHYFNGKEPFFGKCAYCEQKIIANQHGDIEHYRPKGKVTNELDQEITRTVGGVVEKHPGYYWLAYDWLNLLPSCGLCNQPSSNTGKRLGKRNRFPVSGQHCFSPTDELDDPLLLNPLVDDPKDHIELQVDTGVLRGKTAKGIMTITVLGLNERSLPEERQEFYQNTYNKLLSEFTKKLNSAPHVYEQSKQDIEGGKKKYSFVSRKAFNDFKDWIGKNDV